MTRHGLGRLLLLLAALVVLSGCAAHGVPTATGPEVPGFWQGLWHGVISPVTLVISLFNAQVGVYAVPNTGNWYDAGFMLGISTVFSSTARSGAMAANRRPDGRPDRRPDRRPSNG